MILTHTIINKSIKLQISSLSLPQSIHPKIIANPISTATNAILELLKFKIRRPPLSPAA